MATESIEDCWIDEGGSDADVRCALHGFGSLDSTAGVRMEETYKDFGGLEQQNSSSKRARYETSATKSKACREKMRRDKLNERYLELGSVLDPGRPPKTDKAAILRDATRMLMQLRSEAQELEESNEELRELIKDLKEEKNELREEKTRLKADKEKLEQQIKASSVPPASFLPHPIAFHPAALDSQVHAPADKTASFTGFPGMAMWQWLPPPVVDTTQDTALWPPNA